MATLKLYLLGPPEIKLENELTQNDQTLVIQRRKVQALLFYLAATNSVQRRATLATLLWSNSDEQRAHGSLRRHLSELNRALEHPLLQIAPYTVRLLPQSALWIDLHEFQRLIATCRAHGHSAEEVCAACIEPLMAAVALYRDDFLAGFTLGDAPAFDEWQTLQSEQLKREMAAVLEKLIRIHQRQGEFKNAIAYAERWLACDPLHEPAHRALIDLHLTNGDRAAALRQYHACVQILKTKLGITPDVETIRRLETINANQQYIGQPVDTSLRKFTAEQPAQTLSTAPQRPATYPYEMPDAGYVHGREYDVALLERWVLDDHCRLIAILGIGGVGKTTLAAKLTQRLAHRTDAPFALILWRSLLNAPPLDELLPDLLRRLTAPVLTPIPDPLDQQLSLLLELLRAKRCLIVLDNLESILARGTETGAYRHGYEPYGQLIRWLSQYEHASCLLLTSRESPQVYLGLERDSPMVRSLVLGGLPEQAGRALLRSQGISATSALTTRLIARYAGHPLALKLVAETIAEFYFGDVAAFLNNETLIFGDVRDLLDQQFARLSPREREIMVWLAIVREPLTFPQLLEHLVVSGSRNAYLEAIWALHRRSLLEREHDGFTLQNVIIEYTTEQFLEQICQELYVGRLEFFHRFPLLMAQAKDYVHESQRRLILEPLSERLLEHFGQDRLTTKLLDHLAHLRVEKPKSYAVGNILNWLLHLGCDLANADFSGLTVWQAHLRGKIARDLNFRGATLHQTLFTDAFGMVHVVIFSPDGQQVAVGTADGQIGIWRTADAKPLRIWQAHTDWVNSICFCPDGHILASGSDDRTIRLWDIASGQALQTFQNHNGRANSICFSPNGDLLASGSDDQTIRLWDVVSGQVLQTFHGHTDRVNSVCFSPAGHILVSGCWDQTIRLWDVANGQLRQILRGHTGRIHSVCISPDGHTLASGSWDQTVRLWDVASGRALQTLRGHTERVSSVCFNPDGRTLASGSYDQRICQWNVASGQVHQTLYSPSGGISSVCFSPDGHLLASGSDDQKIRLWDIASGQTIQTLQGYSSWLSSACLTPDGQIVASGGWDQAIHLWDSGSGKALQTLLGHSGWINAVCFSPTGDLLASASDDRTVRLWDVASGQVLHIFQDHTGWARTVCFSPDGQTLVSGSWDKTLRLWDVASGQALQTLQGHTGQITSVCFSPNGQTIASGSWDQSITLWDSASSRAIQILQGHASWIASVCFSPDGQLLASGGADQTLRLWDVSSGQVIQTFPGHTDWINAVCFSPDGQTIASGSASQRIRLWDVASGQALCTLSGHTDWVNSICFSQDASVLVSSSTDGTVKLWDLESGDCLKTLRPDRPYERMNITGVRGLTPTQIAVLKDLGAIENL